MKDIIAMFFEGAYILNDLLVSAKAVPLPVHQALISMIFSR